MFADACGGAIGVRHKVEVDCYIERRLMDDTGWGKPRPFGVSPPYIRLLICIERRLAGVPG